jgi:hypothetical protein
MKRRGYSAGAVGRNRESRGRCSEGETVGWEESEREEGEGRMSEGEWGGVPDFQVKSIGMFSKFR